MKKNSPSQSLPEFEALDEGTVLDWLHKNSSNIVYGCAILVALICLGYWFLSRNTVKYETDYFTAESAIVKLQQPIASEEDKIANAQAVENLTRILNSHAELQPKYDGIIAQTLLQQDKTEEALPFAKRNLQRVKVDNLPFYNDYAEGTLLVAQKQYTEALENALKTQALMEAESKRAREENNARNFGDSLYAFNTLRIAMLQQKLEQKSEANKTWDKLMQELLSNSSLIQDKRAVEAVIAHINDSGVSLSSYIEAQK